jgi:hypothetical protein
VGQHSLIGGTVFCVCLMRLRRQVFHKAPWRINDLLVSCSPQDLLVNKQQCPALLQATDMSLQ